MGDAIVLVDDVFGVVLERGVDVHHVGDYGGVLGDMGSVLGFKTAVEVAQMADFALHLGELLAVVGILVGGLAGVGSLPSNVFQIPFGIGLKVGVFKLETSVRVHHHQENQHHTSCQLLVAPSSVDLIL